MKTYKPKAGPILGILCFAAMFLGFGVFIVVRGIEISNTSDSIPISVSVLISLLFLVFGFYFGGAGLQAFMAVDTDSEGITTRAWWGRKRILWSDIVYAEVAGSADDNFILQGRQGARIELDTTILVDGTELRAVVATRIETALEAVMQLWQAEGTTLRARTPFRTPAAISILIFAALCLVGVGAAANIPHHSFSDAAASVTGMVLGVLGALIFVWLFLYAFTGYLKLTPDGISVRSVVSNKQIAFRDIVAVSTRESDTQNTVMRIVTVRDRANKKILLTSSYPNSSLLVRIIQQAADASVLEAGAHDLKALASKENRTRAKFLLWASPVYIAMFLAPGIMMIVQGNARIAHYNRISTDGTPVAGTVTGKEVRGGKSSEYVVDYTFMAADASGNLRPIKAASPVSYDNWNSAMSGQSVNAVYIRSEPELCHMMTSTAGELGAGTRTKGIIYLVLGLCGTAFYIWMIYKSRLQAAGKWKDPEPPAGTVNLAAPERFVLQRDLQRIGIARMLGMQILGWGVGITLGLGMIMMALSSSVPVVREAMSSHPSPLWFKALILVPACTAMAGMLIVSPLGEW